MEVPLWLVLLGLELPVVMALLDCWNRPAEHFPGGAPDRRAWLRWLVVAVPSAVVLVGYGIVMGYYFSIVKRSA